MLKNIVLLTVLLLGLLLAGCSDNSGPVTPESQLASIATLLAKGYEMSPGQQADITAQVARAKEMLAAGNKTEAGSILATVLKDLEVIGETDRFNKSE